MTNDSVVPLLLIAAGALFLGLISFAVAFVAFRLFAEYHSNRVCLTVIS